MTTFDVNNLAWWFIFILGRRSKFKATGGNYNTAKRSLFSESIH